MATFFDELNNAVNTHHTPDSITRMNIGLSTIHPKINGYFYIFLRVPKGLRERGINEDKVMNWISGTAINFTPHSTTPNVIDINALNGLQHSYISGQTISRDISVTYYDYQGSPIYKFHKLWKEMTIVSSVGLSMLDDYTLEEYGSTMLVIVTKPVGGNLPGQQVFQFQEKHIEHVWIYPAVILTSSDQTDALNQDITAPAEVQLSYSYRFNGYPIEDIYVPELKQHAAELLNNLKQDQSKSKYTSAWISNPMIDELVNNIIPH